jgi:Family of unknown function (DUF6607)
VKAFLSVLLGLAAVLPVLAEKTAIPQQIHHLSGCFRVSYRYVEDGIHDKEIDRGVIEWVALSRIAGGYSLQHVGLSPNEAMQHWREDWIERGSEWQQRVYGPSGVFRYECRGKFQLNQLRCLSHGAPKPLRDRQRTDYDKLDRENILQITPGGWVHLQVNLKVTNDGKVVSNELGWNEYRRIDEKACEEVKKRFPSD